MRLDERQNIYYLRLSREDGDIDSGNETESNSISSQRVCIRHYIEENGMNCEDFTEVSDDGYSGTNMHRPGIQKILKMAESGNVKTIIVRDLSRFARNYLEAGHYLEFIFPMYGVRFISVNDGYDSLLTGETTGGLGLAIHNLINQMYSMDISRKIKSAVDMKKLNGEYVYGTAPYGYKKGEKKNTIVPDKAAAPVVKNIFEWAASGMTVTSIARKLNAMNVVTPSVYLADVRGKYKTRSFWTFDSVRNILENRIYTGDTVPFKSHVIKVGSNRVKQIPTELQTVIPNTHEPIITRDLFYLAQTVKRSVHKNKSEPRKNLFTSLLVCGCCENRLSKGKAQNKYWRCANSRYTTETDCKNVKIEESALKNIILRAVTMQCKMLDIRLTKIKKESSSVGSDEYFLKKEISSYRSKIEQAKDAKIRLYEDYADGILNVEDYKSQKNELLRSTDDLQLKLKTAECRLAEIGERLKQNAVRISESEAFSKYSEITDLTPELAKELIDGIVVFPNGTVRIKWNFADETANIIEMQPGSENKAV